MVTLTSKQREAVEERLVSGEKVLAVGEISSKGIYWKSIAVFGIALLFAMFVASELGVLLGVTALVMFGYAAAVKAILLLVITDKRVIVRYGLLQIEVVDLHFDKVESIELERMLTGYIMGYANVVIMGTGNRFIRIPYVANGAALRKAYNELTLGGEDS